MNLAGRLDREGLRHGGIYLAVGGRRHRVDIEGLTGNAITVYPQHELVKDLIASAPGEIVFEARDVSITDGRVRYNDVELAPEFIAGCDGFHGISRPSVPEGALTVYERVYPFAWLGVMAEAAPSSEELVYAHTDRGFALFSMRSPTLTRLYLQCAPEEDLSEWSDDRIWQELDARLATSDGWRPNHGRILQRGVTPMRSFVVEPMQHGNLFLAGDAAHIVPPTGAKGLNLAAADVLVLSRGLGSYFRTGDRSELDRYSSTCLNRIWNVQRFSWWMTSLLHRFEGASLFDRRRQEAELHYLLSSTAAMTALAENYAGLPFV